MRDDLKEQTDQVDRNANRMVRDTKAWVIRYGLQRGQGPAAAGDSPARLNRAATLAQPRDGTSCRCDDLHSARSGA